MTPARAYQTRAPPTHWSGLRYPPGVTNALHAVEHRDQQVKAGARLASRALMGAAVLCLIRAVILVPLLAWIVALLPASERGQFAGYLDPLANHVSLALAATFAGFGLVARKRPLIATLVCLALFLATAVPFVVRNPVLIGGGHLGRLVMLLILVRAVLAGLGPRAR